MSTPIAEAKDLPTVSLSSKELSEPVASYVSIQTPLPHRSSQAWPDLKELNRVSVLLLLLWRLRHLRLRHKLQSLFGFLESPEWPSERTRRKWC